MSGQINANSPFGNELVKLAKHPEYFTYLDVGTWNGQGSTKILVDNCKNKRIYSIEANEHFYKEALKYYTPKPYNLHLLHGRLSHSMMSDEEVKAHPLFDSVKNHYNLHFKQDCLDFANTSVVNLPPYADVVILDGGEFCGYDDLEAVLKLHPIVIALDDTKVMKNYDNNKKLEKMGWNLVCSGPDRNGWAIWKCPESDKTRHHAMYRYLEKYLELPFGY
jgi:hypothetical protein